MAPVIVYMVCVIPVANNSAWMILGWVGSFIVGIGLFNFVSIIIQQYLGHLVSILSFLIGGIMVALSLWLMSVTRLATARHLRGLLGSHFK